MVNDWYLSNGGLKNTHFCNWHIGVKNQNF